jgi:hypothetical protein
MTITVLPTNYVNGDIFSATDINNTNTVINILSGSQSLIAAKGDILTGSADDTLVKTTVGANNTVLIANSAASGGVAWGLITSAMITDGTITGTDIAGTTITGSNIANTTISSGKVDGTIYIRGETAGFTPTNARIHIRSTAPSSPASGDIWFQI